MSTQAHTPEPDNDVPIHRAEWPHVVVAVSLLLAGLVIIYVAHGGLS